MRSSSQRLGQPQTIPFRMATEDARSGINGLTPDVFYDVVKQVTGHSPSTGIFDRRLVRPLDQLPDSVEAETGEMLAPERLGDLSRGRLAPAAQGEGNR